MHYIENPGLPETEVGLAAVSGTYPQLLNALHQYGVQTIPVLPEEGKSVWLAGHSDLRVFHAGGRNIYIAAGTGSLKQKLMQYDFTITQLPYAVSSPYPNDVRLNALILGNKAIVNQLTIGKEILDYIIAEKYQIISVKQGYARCSAAVVDENSIITSDSGIARAAAQAGIDVLKITEGFIRLEGFQYGFIGGACGKISKNKIAFCGRFQEHPDYASIKRFLEAREIEPIVLADIPLTDIGGIISLMEF
jgi:hypothetical protein